jgi:hypothetical protein
MNRAGRQGLNSLSGTEQGIFNGTIIGEHGDQYLYSGGNLTWSTNNSCA